MQPEEIKAKAIEIAEKIGESEAKPIKQIELLLEKCGMEFVQQIFDETEDIETKGGMETHDKKRKRTKGGVFFFLAKGRMDASIRQDIFPQFGKHNTGEVLPMGINWENRLAPMEALREEAGQVHNLSVTLIGRPGKVAIDGSSVMMVVAQNEVKSPPYPKGVPPYETVDSKTTYYVFMGLKHWQKVETVLQDETDLLIVEGTGVYDTTLGGIVILTTFTSTKGLERQKQLEKQDSQAQDKKKPEKSNAKSDNNKKPAKQDKPAKPVLKPSTKEIPSDVPSSVADKLKQLYSAADTLKQKIEVMESKGQKSGLDMTKRLLENTEKQIASLEQQYKK